MVQGNGDAMFDFGANIQQQPPAQQSHAAPDVFDEIGSADPSAGRVYPLPGVYPLVMVNGLKMIRSRKGDNCFIAELDIIQSQVDGRPVGSTMSYVANFRHDASPGNVRAMLGAVLGCDPKQVTGAISRHACSDQNPCFGRLVRLDASNITTRAGNPFTLCNWSPVPQSVQDQAMQLHEQAGFPPLQ